MPQCIYDVNSGDVMVIWRRWEYHRDGSGGGGTGTGVTAAVVLLK